MTRRNKYVKRSRISERKFRQLVKLFSLVLDAVLISVLSHLNRNTVNRYLAAMRTRIVDFANLNHLLKVKSKLMKVISELKGLKENEDGVRVVKQLYLESLNAMGRYIQKLYQMLVVKRFRILLEAV